MQLCPVALEAERVAPDAALAAGVGGDLGDDERFNFGDRGAVPAVAEPAGDDGVGPGMPRAGWSEKGGQGSGLRRLRGTLRPAMISSPAR